MSEHHASGLGRAILALGACLGLGAGATGCFVITDSGDDPSPRRATPDEESVETGAAMSVSAGAGAGLWVEYQSGGAWDLYTSCDAAVTDRPCAFDVLASAELGVPIHAVQLHDHEPVDSVELRAEGGLRMITRTAAGLDGVRFTTDPGAAIQIDMLLDGQAQPTFINWVSGGARVTGTNRTTNPLVFVPTFP